MLIQIFSFYACIAIKLLFFYILLEFFFIQLHVYNEILIALFMYHLESYLEAGVINYNISTSTIGFTWGNSSRDDDLVRSYRVKLTEYRTGTLIANVSVGTNRCFHVDSDFIPGNRYIFSIISTVVLSDPSETIVVTRTAYCTVGG